MDNATIVRPGFAGNILLGAVVAFISWGLYGAFSGAIIYGSEGLVAFISRSISTVAGAILTGIGGARWLTNEVDKTLLRTASIYCYSIEVVL